MKLGAQPRTSGTQGGLLRAWPHTDPCEGERWMGLNLGKPLSPFAASPGLGWACWSDLCISGRKQCEGFGKAGHGNVGPSAPWLEIWN